MTTPSPLPPVPCPFPHPDPAAILVPVAREALRPDPDITVDEWADRYRILTSEASAEPGRWRTSRFPFGREPMRAMSPRSPYRVVALRWAAQTSKTELEINAALCYTDIAPGPMLWLMPDERVMRRVAEQRLDPAIRGCPERFRGKLHTGGGRKGGNTILSRTFPGGNLDMGTAASPSFLASKPTRYVLMDEVDRFKRSAGDEGRPISLAIKRTENFHNAKIIITSTPTTEGSSEIDDVIDETDDRRFLVPCPHCGAFQELVFAPEFAKSGIKPHGRLVWQNDDPETAKYQCGHCEELIDEVHKGDMLARGRWQASQPARNPAAVGFSLNGLYTPPGFTQTWKEIVRKFLEARGKPLELKVFVNTVLAQSWQERGQAPDYERLHERAEEWPIGTVPRGRTPASEPCYLTCGVDTQADRLEYLVVAWAENQESYVIDRGLIPGDPHKPEPWLELDRVLAKRYPCAAGGDLGVSRLAVDTGYAAHEVYNWARTQRRDRVLAIKGDTRGANIVSRPTLVDVNHRGRTIRSGVLLWKANVDMLKHELYSFLRRAKPSSENPEVPGYVHLPRFDLDFFQQLTAEALVSEKGRDGRLRREWRKLRERNEMLDCLSADTEVLTRNGWRFFPDLSENDELATVNLEQDLLEYQRPLRLIARPHKGDMVSLPHKRLGALVTPNHRMVVYTKERPPAVNGVRPPWNFDTKPRIVLAGDLTVHDRVKMTTGWRGIERETITIPASAKPDGSIIQPAVEIPAGDWAEFLGWYVSEGHRSTNRPRTQPSSLHRVVCIAQKTGPNLDRILELVRRLPWSVRCYHKPGGCATVHFASKQLYDALEPCGLGSENLRVPQWVKDSAPDIIRRFLESYLAGDGWAQQHKPHHRPHFAAATVSRLLADDIQELLLKLGMSASITVRPGKPWKVRGRSGPKARDQYHIHAAYTKTATLDGGSNGRRGYLGETVQYDGMVYCATVPNGTLVVRRKGKMCIVGNCANYARFAFLQAGGDKWKPDIWERLRGDLFRDGQLTPPAAAPKKRNLRFQSPYE